MRRRIATLLGISVLAFLLSVAGAKKVNAAHPVMAGDLPVPICGPGDPKPCPGGGN